MEELQRQKRDLVRRLQEADDRYKVMGSEFGETKNELTLATSKLDALTLENKVMKEKIIASEEVVKSVREELRVLELDAKNKLSFATLQGRLDLLRELEKGMQFDYSTQRANLERDLQDLANEDGLGVNVVTVNPIDED